MKTQCRCDMSQACRSKYYRVLGKILHAYFTTNELDSLHAVTPKSCLREAGVGPTSIPCKREHCSGTHTHSRDVMQRLWAPTARLLLCFIYQYILMKDYLRHQRSLSIRSILTKRQRLLPSPCRESCTEDTYFLERSTSYL